MMLLLNANKVLAKILFWGEILRQRKQLSKMDDYLLKDIGISRVEAAREANRKFWDHAPVVDESLRRRTDMTLAISSKKKNTAFNLLFD
jgi:uncharacterized protein YjiS (DUF1127 family)